MSEGRPVLQPQRVRMIDSDLEVCTVPDVPVAESVVDEIQVREVGFFRLHDFDFVLVIVVIRTDVVKYGVELLLA